MADSQKSLLTMEQRFTRLDRCAEVLGFPTHLNELRAALSDYSQDCRRVLEAAEDCDGLPVMLACLSSIMASDLEVELDRVYACRDEHLPGIVRRVLPMLVYTCWEGEYECELLAKIMPHLAAAIAGDSAGIEDAINEAAMRF